MVFRELFQGLQRQKITHLYIPNLRNDHTCKLESNEQLHITAHTCTWLTVMTVQSLFVKTKLNILSQRRSLESLKPITMNPYQL